MSCCQNQHVSTSSFINICQSSSILCRRCNRQSVDLPCRTFTVYSIQRPRHAYKVSTTKQVIEAPQAPRRVPKAREWSGRWVGSAEGCPPPSRLAGLGSVVSSPSGVWHAAQPLSIFVHFACYFVRSEAYKFRFQHHPRVSFTPV